jgi:hypothetical protein
LDKVYALEGGFRAWVQAGYPLEDKEHVQTGCLVCHRNVTPNVVEQWQKSAHAEEVNGVACAVCHGQEHTTMNDVSETVMPGADTCRTCHEKQWGQFASGQHAKAWMAAQALPDYHWQPLRTLRGLQGCLSCHGIGLPSQKKDPDQAIGDKRAACSHCHESHAFSREKAAHPHACRRCHMGSEHQSWESYLSSAHGQQFLKHGGPDEPGEETYPVCQTCHMNQGGHGVMTAWGGLGLREPGALDDPDWAEAQTTLLRFIGLLDADGQPTQRMNRFQDLGVIRSSGTKAQKARAGMLRTCLGCHEARFVKKEIDSAEEIARQADLITAEAIRSVWEHHSTQGALPEADGSGRDAFTLEDSNTLLGQHVFTMFRKHRKSAWRGGFHMSPERAFWKGLHQLRRDVVRIKTFKGEAADDENSLQEFRTQESE